MLLGIAGEGRTLTLPSDLLVGKDMALIGSIAYPAATWSRVVGLVADRVLDLDPIVTHRFPMSEFEEAVALMDDRRGIVAKIVLEHALGDDGTRRRARLGVVPQLEWFDRGSRRVPAPLVAEVERRRATRRSAAGR